ncbi:hypothetical protein KIN20_030629 [Parelaphostrongylus tenuis]|uniref:Uncharacterized protein n=1 Tax=Parelaphostrongylus tenuis TaxID=148309 RepID=A0AAD5R4B6_PARTN|nr:hypothetical protein KIN20_030629 [Parelaphostrongylus tenuis]
MVYSSAPVASFPAIAPNEETARGFVERLVMQTVFDVLERQGRRALLSDAVISAILGQLKVTINYTPLNCKMSIKPGDMCGSSILNYYLKANRQGKAYFVEMKDSPACIIVENTVTGICIVTAAAGSKMCKATDPNEMVEISAINGTHLTIPGTLSTTNIIMADWSRMMWQSVVDRAIRMLALGPLGSHFFSARATVGGN